MIDNKTVPRPFIERRTAKLLSCPGVGVVFCGAGSSGLLAACYLAKDGMKVSALAEER